VLTSSTILRRTPTKPSTTRPVPHMDTDYIADLEEENRTLRSRVARLEEELRQVREDLRKALERKVEEVSVAPHSHLAGMDTTNALIVGTQ